MAVLDTAENIGSMIHLHAFQTFILCRGRFKTGPHTFPFPCRGSTNHPPILADLICLSPPGTVCNPPVFLRHSTREGFQTLPYITTQTIQIRPRTFPLLCRGGFKTRPFFSPPSFHPYFVSDAVLRTIPSRSSGYRSCSSRARAVDRAEKPKRVLTLLMPAVSCSSRSEKKGRMSRLACRSSTLTPTRRSGRSFLASSDCSRGRALCQRRK